jgi:hypothetical protein
MSKLSGWQKAGLMAGIGCLTIVGVVVVGLLVAVTWARSTMARFGDPTPTRTERTISLPAPETAPGEAAPTPGAASSGSEPLRLSIDLEGGSFTVQPGPPGSQVKVEGTYAQGFYELTETTNAGAPGGARRTTIRFRSKAPMWARVLGGIGGGGGRPELTVSIPEGLAIDLSLRVAMGESRIDLGGLTLRDLGLEMSMGNHRIDFKEPLAEGVRRVNLSAQMGNVSIENLGNTRAAAIEASGNMGNLEADLGGAWPEGAEAEASFTQSMGELTVNVPRTVRLETSIRSGRDETENRPAPAEETSDPNAPMIRLRVSTSMGESRVNRY